eukprot:9829853-Alexandrium_andersonii.AAC.1
MPVGKRWQRRAGNNGVLARSRPCSCPLRAHHAQGGGQRRALESHRRLGGDLALQVPDAR